MTDEEREKKQIERNARSFAESHFKNMSYARQRAAEEAYLLIVRDGIIY
jgi:hypothetical protein